MNSNTSATGVHAWLHRERNYEGIAMKVLPAVALTGHLYRVVAGALLLAALGACGYKGPLRLPPPPPVDTKLAAPPTPLPLPADNTDAQSSQHGIVSPATDQ